MDKYLPYEIGFMAEKLIDLDIYSGCGIDENKESVKRLILDEPIDVISYLLDYIDELQG